MSFYCDCKKKGNPRYRDSCLNNLIALFKTSPYEVVASCCGHGKYPVTLVICSDHYGATWEYFSEKKIPRKSRFYKKDKQGFYYIPEVTA